MDQAYRDLKSELDELKTDVRRLEDKINVFEENPHFQNDDVRYNRLVGEKQLLLNHLCELRTNIYMKVLLGHASVQNVANGELIVAKNGSSNSANPDLPSAKRPRTNNKRGFSEMQEEGEVIEYFVDRNEDKEKTEDNLTPPHTSFSSQPAPLPSMPQVSPKPEGNLFQPSTNLPLPAPTLPPSNSTQQPPAQSGHSQNSTGSGVDNSIPQSQPIPPLQLEEYLQMKMKLAQIMRDFNDKKICFIGMDNSRIYVHQYQQISSRVKSGEDISKFLRGNVAMFVTAVDKKKRSITETKLFIPDYEANR